MMMLGNDSNDSTVGAAKYMLGDFVVVTLIATGGICAVVLATWFVDFVWLYIMFPSRSSLSYHSTGLRAHV